MAYQFSKELIRFITGIQISSDGVVPLNNLEDSELFESELYTPEYSVSILTLNTLKRIKRKEIDTNEEEVPNDTLTYKVLNSDLSAYAPSIHLLARLVVLESFSVVFCINEAKDDIQYLTQKDIKRLKENINYLADYMGTEDRYNDIIEILRNMYIALGYIEHQTDVIMTHRREGR